MLNKNIYLQRMLSCFSHVCLFVTPWTVAHQAPLSMGFFRQEYWSGWSSWPTDQTWASCISCTVSRFYTTSTTWEALYVQWFCPNSVPNNLLIFITISSTHKLSFKNICGFLVVLLLLLNYTFVENIVCVLQTLNFWCQFII